MHISIEIQLTMSIQQRTNLPNFIGSFVSSTYAVVPGILLSPSCIVVVARSTEPGVRTWIVCHTAFDCVHLGLIVLWRCLMVPAMLNAHIRS